MKQTFLFGCIFLLSGCQLAQWWQNLVNSGNGGSPNQSSASPTFTSLSISPTSISLPAGTTERLSAQATYSDGSVKDVTTLASWSIDNSATANVSNTGVLTASAQSIANVTATYSGQTATAPITVTPAKITSIMINKDKRFDEGVPEGLSLHLHAVGTFSDGSVQNLTDQATFSSTSPANAVMTGSTLVAISPGTTTVTATWSTVVSLPVTIAIIANTPLAIKGLDFFDRATNSYTAQSRDNDSGSSGIYDLPASDKFYPLSAVIKFASASPGSPPSGDQVPPQSPLYPVDPSSAYVYYKISNNVTYTFSDPTILQPVTLPDGTYAAETGKPGSGTLTAAFNGISASFTINVSSTPEMTGISLAPINEGHSIPVGASVPLTVNALFSDGSTQPLSPQDVVFFLSGSNATLVDNTDLLGKLVTDEASHNAVTAYYKAFEASQSFTVSPASSATGFFVTGAPSVGSNQYVGTASESITVSADDLNYPAALFTYTVSPPTAVTINNQSTTSIAFTPVSAGLFTIFVSETVNGTSIGSGAVLNFTIGDSNSSQLGISVVNISPSEQLVVASDPAQSSAIFTFTSSNPSVVPTQSGSSNPPSPNAQLFINNTNGPLNGVVVSVVAMVNETVVATGSITLNFLSGAASSGTCIVTPQSNIMSVGSGTSPVYPTVNSPRSAEDLFTITSADGVTPLQVLGFHDTLEVAQAQGGNFGPGISLTVNLTFNPPPLGPDKVKFLVRGPSGVTSTCETTVTFVPAP